MRGGEAAQGPPGFGQRGGTRGVGAQAREAVADPEVGGQEGIVLAGAQSDVGQRPRADARQVGGDGLSAGEGGGEATTRRAARVVAAATEICWPSRARIASSAGSGWPGTRRPGAERTDGPSSGSLPSRRSIAAGSVGAVVQLLDAADRPPSEEGDELARVQGGVVGHAHVPATYGGGCP